MGSGKPSFFALLLLRLGLVAGIFFPEVETSGKSPEPRRLQPITPGAPLLFGTRGDDTATAEYAAKHGLVLAKSEVQELSGRDTSVRFTQNIESHDVTVLLPNRMVPNVLMEALMTVRTAKTEGALRVTVVTKGSLSEVRIVSESGDEIDVDLAVLLKTAGAGYLQEGNHGVRKFSAIPEFPEPQAAATHQGLLMDLGHSSLARELAARTGLKMVETEMKLATNAQIYLLLGLHESVNETLFQAMAKVRDLVASGNRVAIVSPYLPYARLDRVDPKGHTTVGGRLVADLIEAAGTSSIVFVRAHAAQSQGFFKIHSRHLSGRPTLGSILKELGVQKVVAPDEGAQKEATLVAETQNLKVTVANKQRDPVTKETKILGISDPLVQGLVVAIVDDELDSGGTGAQVAALLKALGAAKVYLICTHLTGNALKALDSTAITGIVVTDTLPHGLQSSDRMRVISIADELAESLRYLESQRLAVGSPN